MITKIDKMLAEESSIDKISHSVHDFYLLMSQRFQENAIYANSSNENLDRLIDLTERQLMEGIHMRIFSKIQAEEEERDLTMQSKIKSLNWLMATHLDIKINLRSAKVRDFLDKAIGDLIGMGSKSLPAEKLQCIYSCSENVCKMLRTTASETNGKIVSADEFLPGLVFVVIKSNPPLLQSNIQYVTLFSNPTRLSSGEAGYYFTNLCCATAFIEKLTGSSLGMKEDEFNRFVSGECLPAGSSLESSMILCSDAFRIMYSNISKAEDLIQRKNSFEFEINELKESMTHFKLEVKNIVEPSIETSKKFLDFRYDVSDDVDEKFIPSSLRTRISKERQERESQNRVLIDLNPVDERQESASQHDHTVTVIVDSEQKVRSELLKSKDSPALVNGTIFDSPLDREDADHALPDPLIPALTPEPPNL